MLWRAARIADAVTTPFALSIRQVDLPPPRTCVPTKHRRGVRAALPLVLHVREVRAVVRHQQSAQPSLPRPPCATSRVTLGAAARTGSSTAARTDWG